MKITNLSCKSKELRAQVDKFIKEWNNEETFITVKTSGSTGNPKIMKIEKSKMINSAKMTGDFFRFKKNQHVLLVLSPKYIAGKMMIVRCITYKMNLLVGELSTLPFTSLNVNIDFCAMTPSQIQCLINKKVNLDTIKNIIIGGASVSNKLIQKINRLVQSNCYATYGMTETLSHIALANIKTEKLYYQCLPNISIAVNNKDCLEITAPQLSDSKIITNDIVKIINEYTFEWKGRSDFVINSGGIKLHAEQIEKKLSSMIQRPFFIFTVNHEKFGQRPAIAIEGKNINDIDDILNNLSKIERPIKIIFFKKFEYTPTGKINRIKTIKKQYN